MKDHVRASAVPSATSTRRTSARRPAIRMPTPLADNSYQYNSPGPTTSSHYGQDTSFPFRSEFPNAVQTGATYYDPQREDYAENDADERYEVHRDSIGSVDDYGGHGTEITDRFEIEHEELDLSHRVPQPDRFNKKRRFGGGFKLLRSIPKILGRKKSSRLPIEQRQTLINEPRIPQSHPHIRVTQPPNNGASPARTRGDTILVPPPSTIGPSEDHLARSHYLSSGVGRSTSQRSHQTHGSARSHTVSERSGHTRDGETSSRHHHQRSISGSHHTSQSSTLPSNPGPSVPHPSLEKINNGAPDDASVITSPQMHLVQIARALRDFHHMPWHDPHHTTTVYVPEVSGRSKNKARLLQQTSKELIVKELDQDGQSWYRPSMEQKRKLVEKGKWPPPSKEPDVPLSFRGRTAAAATQLPRMTNSSQLPPRLTTHQSQSRPHRPITRGVDSVPPMPQMHPFYVQSYSPFGPVLCPVHPSYMSGSTNMSGHSASTGLYPGSAAQDAQPSPQTPSMQSHATVRPSNNAGGHSINVGHPQTPVTASAITLNHAGLQSPGFMPPMYPYPHVNMGPNGLPLGFMPGMTQPTSPRPGS